MAGPLSKMRWKGKSHRPSCVKNKREYGVSQVLCMIKHHYYNDFPEGLSQCQTFVYTLYCCRKKVICDWKNERRNKWKIHRII